MNFNPNWNWKEETKKRAYKKDTKKKKPKPVVMARRIVLPTLREMGLIGRDVSNVELVRIIREQGLLPNEAARGMNWKKALIAAAEYFEDTGKTKRPKKSVKTRKQNRKEKLIEDKEFLSSYAWKKLRYQALQLHGRRCMCCGATPEDGEKMNVDHIKPRKRYPELALDINNLQVLCGTCNHGKGNWDETDWRAEK